MTSTRPTRQLSLDLEFEDEQPAVAEPLGGQSCAAAIGKPALDSATDDLMELIVESDNMDRAWKRVRANRGAPGADGMTIAQFPDFIRENWPTIRQQLLDGTYKPQPVRRKSIPKPDGQGERLLGIPVCWIA